MEKLICGLWGQLARPVRHTKAGTKVLGKQPDSIPITFRILLQQVFHGVHQMLLPLDIVRPQTALLAFASGRIG